MGSKVNPAGRFFPLERTRNIGIAAHIDAGKTTLTERILYYTGSVRVAGDVDHGDTITDWMPLEREKGITITAASVTCSWKQVAEPGLCKSFPSLDHRINLIDTPGHVDFTAEVERSLRVLDGVVAVFCGVAGVQPQSETVWRQANKYRVPRIAFINKMDRIGADFSGAVEDMRKKLAATALPILLPLGKEHELRGQIDVINQVAIVYDPTDPTGRTCAVEPIPPGQQELARNAYRDLVTQIANLDDEVGLLFIEEKPVAPAVLKAAIRRQTIANRFVPVVGGSAFRNKGVQPLLDAIVDYLPSPLDIPPAEGHHAHTGKVVQVNADDSAKLCALAFKLWTDPDAGKLVFIRVYSGTLSRGDTIHNPRTKKRERITRLLQVQADRKDNIEACYAGEIAAVVGVKNVTTGDTLCSQDYPVLLEPPSFPVPVVSMAVEPRRQADRDKLAVALQRLAEDDPTFHVSVDRDTGQTIIAGMGELHLEILQDRMRRDFGVESNAGRPQIAYRETVLQAATGEFKHVKQHGGAGQYGHVVVAVTPNERGKGHLVRDKIEGGAIPAQFIPSCKKGIEEALRDGVLLGYPVIDVQVDLVGGSSHPVDSNELAFELAAIFATQNALKNASPALLEPIMKVECNTPEEYQGDILGDLNSRRGHIHGVESKVGSVNIHAEVPLAEMFGYANAIRSLSKGRAAYSMEPSHFEPVPPEISQAMLQGTRI